LVHFSVKKVFLAGKDDEIEIGELSDIPFGTESFFVV
jgi:hypothetical protein